MSEPRPVFVCTYRDGTKRVGSYIRTLEWFNEAQNTSNPCVVTAAHTGYTNP